MKRAWILLVALLACDNSVPWSSAEFATPSEVTAGATVIYVGPKPLFERGHVPGAVFGGQAGTDDGMNKLVSLAQTLPKDRDVIIYCGCCPRTSCPNIRPAFTKLKSMGLRVKVLDMPNNFHDDWEDKGHPVAK